MNYIEVIKAAWKWFRNSNLEPNDFCLFLWLIAISNDDMAWEDSFMRNNYELMGSTKLSYRQIDKSRKKLQAIGLISFEQRNGIPNTKYKIHFDTLLNLSKKSKGLVKEEERLSNGIGNGNGIDKLNYTKQNYTKQNSIEAPGGATQAHNFDSEPSVKNQTKAEKENRPRRREIFVPPSMEHVKQYFTEKMYRPNGAGGWMPDTISNEANKFFNHYTANGWVQGKNKPIKVWEAAVNKWISNCKEGAFGTQKPQTPEDRQVSQLAQVRREESLPRLSQGQLNINYQFERYCEDPGKITFMGIDITDYDVLKSAGKIGFTSEQAEKIKQEAKRIASEMKLQTDERTLLNLMKKLGVMEFFKIQKEDGETEIF